MKGSLRTVLNIVMVCLLAAGAFFYVKNVSEKKENAFEYEEARKIATSTQSTETVQKTEEYKENKPREYDPVVEQLIATDLKALQEINPEVVGWVYIPETEIDYPVLQHSDNEYYLNHSWENTKNPNGAIFFDCETSLDLTDFNTLVYGHRINNKLMFSGLSKFNSLEYINAHPSVYLVTEKGVCRYDIFSAYQTGMQTIAFAMRIETENMRKEFINFAVDYSEAFTGVVPEPENSFLTLATCNFNGSSRQVVQAVLNEEVSYFHGE